MRAAELLAGVAPPPGGGMVVALSGGADSAVAAWVVTTQGAASVRAVHIDHGTPDAAQLAAAAAAIAGRLQLPLEAVAVEVRPGPSWEGEARQARWAAMRAKAGPTDVVVTGHHRDDLAETVLGNLVRGAGAAGLAAMASSRSDIYRPLLHASRDEVRAVADELDLPYYDDPSNRDLSLKRNRIRHEVIPHLAATFNPQLSAALARSAHALAADDALLDRELRDVPLIEDAWGAWKVPAPVVTTAEPAVAARLVRQLLRAARPPYGGSTRELSAVLRVVDGLDARCELGGGITVELEGPWLVAHRGDAIAPPPAECAVPGSAQFGAIQVDVAAVRPALLRRTSLLSRRAIGSPLTLRTAQPGEAIEIAAGSKPVREVLAEAAVPRRLRSAWPVAEAHGRIAAVAGIRSAPWARGRRGGDDTYELTARERQL